MTDQPASAGAGAMEAIDGAEAQTLFAGLSAYDRVVLAVSSGSDSMAMLHLAARSGLCERDRTLVVTIDHGLRTESAGEAHFVAQVADRLGYPHVTLDWTGDKPATGLQEAARKARYALIEAEIAARWPGERVAVVVAHTQDDQSETVLMRLARGSGVDGLAGMAPERRLRSRHDVWLVRPLLDVPKARLRATLEVLGEAWREDPSNAQLRFERVRLRQARAALDDLGITSAQLSRVAQRLAKSRAALNSAAEAALIAAGLDFHGGAYAELDLAVLKAQPDAIRERMLMAIVAPVGGRGEPLRLSRIEALNARFDATDSGTWSLGGAIVSARAGRLTVWREPDRGAFPVLRVAPGAIGLWDGRFEITLSQDAPGPVTVVSLVEFQRLDSPAKADRALAAVSELPKAVQATLPVVMDDRSRSIVVLSTHLQPEWKGYVTVRFAGCETAGKASPVATR